MQRTQLFFLALIATVLLGFGCKSTKAVVWTPVGDWQFTVSNTPEGDVSGVLTISEDGDGYTGSIGLDAGNTSLKNVKIMDKKLTASFNYSGYDLDIEGTFEGEVLKGEISYGFDSFPMTATRKLPG